MIDLPVRLSSLLNSDAALHGAVLTTFASFEPWLRDSKMPFFPEFTDHSDRHVRDVLRTAISIVRDSALSILTPGDAAMLCLSCLLHDSAMHLSEVGFLTLLNDRTWKSALPNDTGWEQLWFDYLSEASRFDAAKLLAIFGTTEPVRKPHESDVSKWSLIDRLLIGDFLRRHHARLAQEFAINGVPGISANRLRLVGLSDDLSSLCGLIARSHGMPLRGCLEFLDADDPRQYKGIHSVFLMSLLRVADYVQLQAERAPKELLKVKRLQSPFSIGEWRVHTAVVDIRNTHKDPEALFVQASPDDAPTYLKIRHLLLGLQRELDESWAVLGEVYGRYPTLAELGLSLRRVRSNLDNEKQFASTVNYIPIHAKFDAAGAELLKLLIRPLYGDRPEVGVRELLQNAIDACLELKDYELRCGTARKTGIPDIDISVCKTGGSYAFKIADKGIGMSVKTLITYFLRAGASYRKSDAWREQFEDSAGHSRVLRSGRFGVGALAAFLLGDEIEVITRHVSEPIGVRFSARLETEALQLEHQPCEIGTTITISLDETVWKRLTKTFAYQVEDGTWEVSGNWDWYCLDQLAVQRRVTTDGKTELNKQDLHLPQSQASLSPEWNRIPAEGFEDVQWTYDSNLARLVCNGLLVEKRSYYLHRGYEITGGIVMSDPLVSVFDPDGRLPLNLQRTGLSTKAYPFEAELRYSQASDYIAWALAKAPTSISNISSSQVLHPHATHKNSVPAFCFSRAGSLLCDKSILARERYQAIYLCPRLHLAEMMPSLVADELLAPLDIDRYTSDFTKHWFRSVLTDSSYVDTLRPLFSHSFSSRRGILRTSLFNELRKPRVIARELWPSVRVDGSNDNWTVFSVEGSPASRVNFDKLLSAPPDAEINGFTELSSLVSYASIDDNSTSLFQAWEQMVNGLTIPFQVDARVNLLIAHDRKFVEKMEFYKHSKTASEANVEVDSELDHPSLFSAESG